MPKFGHDLCLFLGMIIHHVSPSSDPSSTLKRPRIPRVPQLHLATTACNTIYATPSNALTFPAFQTLPTPQKTMGAWNSLWSTYTMSSAVFDVSLIARRRAAFISLPPMSTGVRATGTKYAFERPTPCAVTSPPPMSIGTRTMTGTRMRHLKDFLYEYPVCA
ncbi:hypothetical protein C8R44DRAFT_806615 [Mycena epipterygia]|nr:hypothetical protein C8R44DRAFT_806615 [Mycena epipterygia]